MDTRRDTKRPTEQDPVFIEHFLLLRGWDHSPFLIGIGGAFYGQNYSKSNMGSPNIPGKRLTVSKSGGDGNSSIIIL